jgi:hypothetical protein
MTKYQLKPDEQEIVNQIEQLKNASWLDKSRSWWPRFIFHFTNINNAIKILDCGKLRCRSELENSGEMVTDNASTTIIQQTNDRWKDYVRMYFRPRTPTQYNNEGFRPEGQRDLDSHCPVPIYFLFDSRQLLVRNNVFFSKGSLASGYTDIYSDASSFKEIPFQSVYHDSWFDIYERDTIIHHRQAEVVVPKELDLDNLKYIFCRSEAEYQTFVDLLDPEVYRLWESVIGTSNKAHLFLKSWIFVEKADLSKESINITFNLPTRSYDPVYIRIVINEIMTGKQYIWENSSYKVDVTLELSLSNLTAPESYRVQVFLDNQIMYSNVYSSLDNELPF